MHKHWFYRIIFIFTFSLLPVSVILFLYKASIVEERLAQLVSETGKIREEISFLKLQQQKNGNEDRGGWPGTSRYRVPRGGHLSIGGTEEPDTLFPGLRGSMPDIEALLFEGLLDYDEEWIPQPRGAFYIPSVENGLLIKDTAAGKENVKCIWKLRPENRWSDGYPVTAMDYIFAFQIMKDPEQPVINRRTVEKIERMEALNPYTLVVYWKDYNCDERILKRDLYCLPKHVLEPIYNKDPGNISCSSFGQMPVGNGPFKVMVWEKGKHIVMARNPYYLGPTPHLEKITYSFFESLDSTLDAIETGNIDLICSSGISPDKVSKIRGKSIESLDIDVTTGVLWEHIDFNLDDPVLFDNDIRRALIYATPRQKIVDDIFGGNVKIAHSWLSVKHYAYNQGIQKYDYSLDMAKKILDKKGWEPGSDGVRINKHGERLSFTIISTAGDSVRERIEQIIKGAWRDAGIELTVHNQPSKAFLDVTTSKRKFPHLAMYAWLISPTKDETSMWESKDIPCLKNNWTGNNYTGLQIPEIDSLIYEISKTSDSSEHIRLLKHLQDLWADTIPCIPLFFYPEVTIKAHGFQNLKPSGTPEFPFTWNAEEWFIER